MKLGKVPMFLGLAAAIAGLRPASGQDCDDCTGLPATPPAECDEAELARAVCCAQADVDAASADVEAATTALATAQAALVEAEGILDDAEGIRDAAEMASDICQGGGGDWVPTIGQTWVRNILVCTEFLLFSLAWQMKTSDNRGFDKRAHRYQSTSTTNTPPPTFPPSPFTPLLQNDFPRSFRTNSLLFRPHVAYTAECCGDHRTGGHTEEFGILVACGSAISQLTKERDQGFRGRVRFLKFSSAVRPPHGNFGTLLRSVLYFEELPRGP